MVRPEISVIIPFYSNIKWLSEAVDSVLSQDYNNCEIIVVNDGSKEDDESFKNKYKGLIKYIKKENGGAASARNCAMEHATGDYLAFLDSDDLWLPNKLSYQFDRMIKHGAQWSYTDYEVFGDRIQSKPRYMFEKRDESIDKTISPYIGTPTVVVSRKFINDNQLSFCTDLKYGQDILMWEQMAYFSPALYIPVILTKVRIRGNNAGRRAAVQIRARVDIYDKCKESIPCYKHTKSLMFRLAILLCRFGRLFVPTKNMNNSFVEFIARLFFVVPYVLFKIDRGLSNS